MAAPKKTTKTTAAITDVIYPWGPKIIQVLDPAYLRNIDPRVLTEIKNIQIEHELEVNALERTTLLKLKKAMGGK